MLSAELFWDQQATLDSDRPRLLAYGDAPVNEISSLLTQTLTSLKDPLPQDRYSEVTSLLTQDTPCPHRGSTDLAVPGAEGLDGTAQHDDLLEYVWIWHNAVKPTHCSPPACTLTHSITHAFIQQFTQMTAGSVNHLCSLQSGVLITQCTVIFMSCSHTLLAMPIL